jgi:hypothetical protein
MEQLCLQEGFSNSRAMVQRDFEFLCGRIESQTGVRISLSTIKRLLQGRFSRFPQMATLNAISQVIGYQGWQHFKVSHSQMVMPGRFSTSTIRSFFQRNPARRLTSATLVVFVAMALFGWLRFSSPHQNNYDKAEFSAHKTTTNEIPNTVVFRYNIDAVEADSFFIQQSWDKKRRVRIDKNRYEVTDIYYEPGYHVAKLIADDQVIKTVDVSIPTDRWFLYAKEKFGGSKLEYIRSSLLQGNGYFGIRKDDLIANHIEFSDEKLFAGTFFPSLIEVSSDNYSLKAKVRVNELRYNACPYLMMEVFTQKYFNFFRMTPKGCAGDSFLQFGEKAVQGKDADLSPLGHDVSEWTDVVLTVKDKEVRIKINEVEVYSITYQEHAGLITGLGFFSNGLCEVDFVELKGLDGSVVYQDDFDEAVMTSK